MPRIVLPDGRVIVVPDDTTPEEMDQIANEAMPTEEAPRPGKGWGETISNALPTVGGMAGSLLGGSRISPVGMALAGVGGHAPKLFNNLV